MFKRIFVMFLIQSVLIFPGCGPALASTPDESSSADSQAANETLQPFDDYYNETFFDVYYTSKPTADDVDQMRNMLTSDKVHMQNVIDILGKPHNFGPTQGVTTLEWETQENGTIHVYVTLPVEIYEQEGEGANYIALLMEYGHAYSMSPFDITITQ